MTTEVPPGWTAEMFERTQRALARANELSAADPSLPPTSAYILANDEMTRELADAAVAAGSSVEEAASLVGSYARFGWVRDQLAAGKLDQASFYSLLPALWTGSDPDDRGEARDIWRGAWLANQGHRILDGPELQPGNPVRVYRGQARGQPLGVSWTLDPERARAFAASRLRQPNPSGRIYRGRIERDNIWAYLTARGEEEVILDPWKFF